jgi:hypothetical protein
LRKRTRDEVRAELRGVEDDEAAALGLGGVAREVRRVGRRTHGVHRRLGSAKDRSGQNAGSKTESNKERKERSSKKRMLPATSKMTRESRRR